MTVIDCTASSGIWLEKYFALLIGDRLAIQRERVRRMVPHAVKESVGVGRHAWRGQRDQRTQLRGRAFQRKFVEQTAVHVGVKRRIVFQQVPRLALRPLRFRQSQLSAE